jgi:hypothetical protein
MSNCEHGSKPLVSVKDEQFLSAYYLSLPALRFDFSKVHST